MARKRLGTRPIEELVLAHDALKAVIEGEVVLDGHEFSRDDQIGISATQQTLCWVLGHETARGFGRDLMEMVHNIRGSRAVFPKTPCDPGKHAVNGSSRDKPN